MASIKGIMLLPLDAESYRRHMAHHTFLAKVNSGTKTPDSRQELTQLVEERVRHEMQQHFSATRFRVLRWEQVDLCNRYVVRFRELDGVFETGNGATILLEVKASASRGSLRTGLERLRAAVKTATHAHASPIGILVVADLGIGRRHDMSRPPLNLAEAGVAGLPSSSLMVLPPGWKISMRSRELCGGRKK